MSAYDVESNAVNIKVECRETILRTRLHHGSAKTGHAMLGFTDCQDGLFTRYSSIIRRSIFLF